MEGSLTRTWISSFNWRLNNLYHIPSSRWSKSLMSCASYNYPILMFMCPKSMSHWGTWEPDQLISCPLWSPHYCTPPSFHLISSKAMPTELTKDQTIWYPRLLHTQSFYERPCPLSKQETCAIVWGDQTFLFLSGTRIIAHTPEQLALRTQMSGPKTIAHQVHRSMHCH